MQSLVIPCLLVVLYITPSTTASLHRRVDRHSDPPNQHNAPNPPTLPHHSYSPSSMPSNLSPSPSRVISKTPSISPSPSEKISETPSLSPSSPKAQSSSPSEPSPIDECNSDANGSFGETTVAGNTKIDVPYNYKMEVNQDYDEGGMKALEREISNLISNQICSSSLTDGANSPTSTDIVGISTGKVDKPIDNCTPQENDESSDCYIVEGDMSIYVDDSRRFLADISGSNLNVINYIRALLQIGMDSGELEKNVIGITGLSWYTGEATDATDRTDRIGDDVDDGDEIFLNVGFALLGGLGFILGVGYGITKYKGSQSASGDSEVDENFEEVA